MDQDTLTNKSHSSSTPPSFFTQNWTIQNTNYIRWRSLDAPLRQSIKSLTLTTLASPSDKAIRNTAAQVVSAIAAAELPEGLWDELIQRLLEFVQGENTGLRIATLQCIGYICEGIVSCGS